MANTFINVLDCTLRDGSYPVNYSYSLEDTHEICVALEGSGISQIEVGHGMGLGAADLNLGQSAHSDMEYIQTALESVRKATIGVFSIPGIATEKMIREAAKAGIGFLRIGADVDKLETTRDLIYLANSLEVEVSLNMMKTYAWPKEEILKSLVKLLDLEIEVISVVDSAGTMIPGQVKDYVGFLSRNLDLKIGFHGHNNLQLAIANSLAAAEGGALVVDATLRGIGRSSGNAQIEALVPVLHKAGFSTNVRYQQLSDFSDIFYAPPYPNYGVQGVELACGVSGLHSSFLPKIIEKANNREIGIIELINEVTSADLINLSQETLNDAAAKVDKKSIVNSPIYRKPRKKPSNLSEWIESLILESRKYGKQSVLTLSPSKLSHTKFLDLTIHENYMIAHVEVDPQDLLQQDNPIFEGIDFLGFDIKLKNYIGELDLLNSFVYDEEQITGSLISHTIANRAESSRNLDIKGYGVFAEQIIKNEKSKLVYNSENATLRILIVGNQIENSKIFQNYVHESDEIYFLNAEFTPLDLLLEEGKTYYRLESRRYFDFHIISLIECLQPSKRTKSIEIAGIKMVSGGLIAPKGSVVVDNILNPSKVMGIASGIGTLLPHHEESEFQESLDTARSVVLSIMLNQVRSGD